MHVKQWRVDVFISEDETTTHAEARLHTEALTPVTGHGRARLSPDDDDIPEIGEELATARALTDLGHRLLVIASRDIQSVTNRPAHLER